MPEQWLTYDALADHWRVSPEAARARVRRGNFTRRTNNLGAAEILLDTDAPVPKARKWGQGRQTGTATPSDTPNTETPSAATVAALQCHIDTLKAALAHAEATAAERGRETAAAHEKLANLSAELVRVSADLLAARQAAEARPRGWWSRLTGTGG